MITISISSNKENTTQNSIRNSPKKSQNQESSF